MFAECAPRISTCILYKLLFCSCYWLNLEKPHTPPLHNWNPNQLLKDSSLKTFLVSTLTYSIMFSFVSCFYKIPNLSIFFPPSRFLISWVQGFVLPPSSTQPSLAYILNTYSWNKLIADGQTDISLAANWYGLIYSSDTFKLSPSPFCKVAETSFPETDHQYRKKHLFNLV